MKKLPFALILLGLWSGCTTARLPKSPDIYSLKSSSSNITIVIEKVSDERGTTKAGTIGAAGILVKDEIIEFTTNHLVSTLNSHMNVNIVMTGSVSPSQVNEIVHSRNANGLVAAKIKSLKIHSIDAIMQPVEVDMDLNVVVYNRQGEQIMEKTFIGHYEKRMGIVAMVDKATGELVDSVVKETMYSLVKDPEFKKAINQLA